MPLTLADFILQTDASDSGLGAVLSKVHHREEHPVIYANQKLTPSEQKYAAVKKEVLAIKWAVLELRYFLLGRMFTLVTNHAPLERAKQNKQNGSWCSRTSTSQSNIKPPMATPMASQGCSPDRQVTQNTPPSHP